MNLIDTDLLNKFTVLGALSGLASQKQGVTLMLKIMWFTLMLLCWSHNKNTLLGRCFITSTSLAPYLFLLDWLKLNLIFLLDQLRLA